MQVPSLFPLRLLLLTGLFLASSVARADLVVTGSSTILPVVKRAALEFTAKTGIKIHASGGGSDHGVKSTLTGQAHIGMVSRKLHEDEAQQLIATPIGLDGVAVFVHERNSIQNLTSEQITHIYRGKILRWRDLSSSGVDDRIVRVGKLHGRSTRELFDGFFGLSGQNYPTDTHMIGANVAAILYVSIDPLSIGYVSFGSLAHAAHEGAPVKALSIEGVAPTEENATNGTYPYVRPLNLVTRGIPRGEARQFIAWMKSKAGQQTLQKEGFMMVFLP